jgi:IclR family pca regulon transcriptional regulator
LNLPTSHDGRYSQSLERGLAILRTFTPEQPWLGIAEIADALEMSRPTTHRYASTLVALGYLEQGPRRKYRLGVRAGDPGRSAVSTTVLRQLPDHCLADLRDRSRCTASLAVLSGEDIVYVDRARSAWQGHSEVTERLESGSRLPAASTAMGRALLAHRGPERRNGALGASPEAAGTREQRESEQDVRARKKLSEELESLREQEFVVADNVRVKGERCVASVVRGRSGDVVGAVDVAAPKLTYSRAQTLERLAPLVVASAEEMSRHLGYVR